MTKSFEDWRKEGKHLPKFLRDFHDQKAFFQFLHEFNPTSEIEMLKNIDEVKGHVYSLDILLYTLARFGYTLQKSKVKLEFDDLDKMVEEYTAERRKKFFDILSNSSTKKDEWFRLFFHWHPIIWRDNIIILMRK